MPPFEDYTISIHESLPRYTIGEEIANGVTHGIDAILAIAALATMIGFAAQRGDAQHIVACSIFGVALIFTYTASTIYHSIPLPTVKSVLRMLGHSAIFVLIPCWASGSESARQRSSHKLRRIDH